MLELANAIQPLLEGWSTLNGTKYCNWNYVWCDFGKRVVGITLEDKNLSGTLPPSLSTLSHLQNLTLVGNKLSGPIPNISNLSSLRALILESNQFDTVPDCFFQGLSSLQFFSISLNTKLQPWHLPNDLAQCTSLVILAAREATVMGTIPDVFSFPKSLKDLDLSRHLLHGTLSSSFMNSTVQNLWLSSDVRSEVRLSGTIDVLASITQLREAYLDYNSFVGQIPYLSNCKNLIGLDLRSSFLTGLILDSLASHPTIGAISFTFNELQGSIPKFWSDLMIELDGNRFCEITEGKSCDPVVTTFLNIAGALHYPLSLAFNWAGNNACSFGNFVTCDTQQRFINVNLAGQNFNGTISQEFCNLTHFKILMLNDNNLTGPIPECLTKLPDLQTLYVSNNNLSGILPNFSSSVTVYTKGNPLLVIPDNFETEDRIFNEWKQATLLRKVLVELPY